MYVNWIIRNRSRYAQTISPLTSGIPKIVDDEGEEEDGNEDNDEDNEREEEDDEDNMGKLEMMKVKRMITVTMKR